MEGTVIVADYYMNIAGNNFVLGRVLTMTHCKGQVLGTYYSPWKWKGPKSCTACPWGTAVFSGSRASLPPSARPPRGQTRELLSAAPVRLFSANSFLKLTAGSVVLISASGDRSHWSPFPFRQGSLRRRQGGSGPALLASFLRTRPPAESGGRSGDFSHFQNRGILAKCPGLFCMHIPHNALGEMPGSPLIPLGRKGLLSWQSFCVWCFRF